MSPKELTLHDLGLLPASLKHAKHHSQGGGAQYKGRCRSGGGFV